jgi:hypothetical protein
MSNKRTKRDREDRNDALDDIYSRKNARKPSQSETISDDAKLDRMQHSMPYLKDVRKMKPTPGKLDSIFIDEEGNEYYRIYPLKQWRRVCPMLNNLVPLMGKIALFRISKVIDILPEPPYIEQTELTSKTNLERKYTVNELNMYGSLYEPTKVKVCIVSDITPFETT